MSRDPRYGTAAWQRLRRQVLAEAGGLCQIQGPRCEQVASSVDHVYPVSTHPELFWQRGNLRAACRKCNYGGGSRIAARNKRREIEMLYELVWKQQAEIDALRERLAVYEENGAKRRRTPAIR
jgi:5-methylcytosine-specific restriction endonuclease McrA